MLHVVANVPIVFQRFTRARGNSVRHDRDKNERQERHQPMDIEWLKQGSKFHMVSPTKDGFSIRAVSVSDEALDAFHAIVDRAIAGALTGGYSIVPHPSSIDPKGRWDFAVITVS
jgi:hypothetical protein